MRRYRVPMAASKFIEQTASNDGVRFILKVRYNRRVITLPDSEQSDFALCSRSSRFLAGSIKMAFAKTQARRIEILRAKASPEGSDARAKISKNSAKSCSQGVGVGNRRVPEQTHKRRVRRNPLYRQSPADNLTIGSETCHLS